MPVQCPTCKALNSDTARFCDGCGRPLDALTAQAAPATPAERKPKALPEEDQIGIGASALRAQPLGMAPCQSTIGVPVWLARHPWRWYLAAVLTVAAIGTVCAFMAESKSDRAHWAFIAVGLICGFATLVLGFPVALWSSRHGTVYGFVTHYREQDPYWAFDLRRTDQGGQPCVDRKGFALPAVPVLYRVDQLHGPPLEEGSRVVVRGGWRLGWFRARAIWNLSLLSEVPTAGVPMVVRGRAINVQPRQDQDMRYPGQWLQVLSFRLQLTDDTFENLLRDVQDNPQPPLPVEVRARVIGGAPQDGDKVEVHGQMVRGILYGREVYDHSAAGAALQVKEYAGAP